MAHLGHPLESPLGRMRIIQRTMQLTAGKFRHQWHLK